MAGGVADWPFLGKFSVYTCPVARPFARCLPAGDAVTMDRSRTHGGQPTCASAVTGHTHCVRTGTSLSREQEQGGVHTHRPLDGPEHTTLGEGTRHERPQSV